MKTSGPIIRSVTASVTPAERAQVRRIVAAIGETAAARELGIGVPSVLRVAAGRPIRRGTIAVLRAALSAAASAA